MKRTNTFYILLFCVGLMSSSCDSYIDKLPEDQLPDEKFWQTENDFKMACNELYLDLPSMQNYQDKWGVDAFGTAPNSISDGTRIEPVTDGNWDSPYKLIRKTNKVIEKYKELETDATTMQNINKYIGEAYFFRAYRYFDLFRLYGGVPLILKTLDIDSPELYSSRAPREKVYNQIIEDLNTAQKYLRKNSEIPEKEYGRISLGAALAFKARVALYEGTRQKFHHYGSNFQDKLKVAYEAADSVMNGNAGSYALYTASGDSSYYYLFHYEGEGSSENIITRLYGESMDNDIAHHQMSREIESARFIPTRALFDDFLCTDGLPIEKSDLFPKSIDSTAAEFINRDPRLQFTFFKNGDTDWYTGLYSTEKWWRSLSGYHSKKYFQGEDWATQQSFVDYMVLRYAEVLLTYAEAKYEADDQISDGDLDKSINLLRDRVGMPHLTNSFVSSNGLEMRTEIRRERHVELGLESRSYDDIIRWKTAEIVMPKAIVGTKIPDPNTEYVDAPKNLNFDSEGNIIVEPEAKRFFDPKKDYLWPLPLNELGLNENLEQNPGW